MEAIFESYNEQGRITASTRYPLLALMKTVDLTTVNDGFNALGYIDIPIINVEDGPVPIVRPTSIGGFITAPGYVSTNGEATSAPTITIKAVSIRSLTWDWRPIAASFSVSLFYQYMIDSGQGLGLQTFAADGTLLYDSQTPAMGIHSIAKGSDWTFDGVVARSGGNRVWFYSVPFPSDSDGFRTIREFKFTSSSQFGGGTAYYGCYTALNRLTCAITTRDSDPTTITEPPWVMFVRKTVRN